MELTLLAGLAKVIPSRSMPRITASRDLMVLLYTTGLYCLHSSLVNPSLWMILERGRERREPGEWGGE